MIIVFDSEGDNDDDDKGWEEVIKITKVNIARVIYQNKKRNM